MLSPQLSYRFSLKFDYDPQQLISNAVLNCSMDFKNNKISMTLRQPDDQTAPKALEQIDESFSKSTRIHIKLGNNNSPFCLTNINLEEHSMDSLDYGTNDVVMHRVVFSYSKKIPISESHFNVDM